MLDLHQFSVPMAKIAVRSYMEALLTKKQESSITDAVFIVGQGKGSDDGKPVLLPAVVKLLLEEYRINASVDEFNMGRLRISKESLESFIERKSWKQ